MITVSMRRCLGLLLSVLMICGCSAVPAAMPTPVRPSVTARPLVDLTKKVKGKIALHHVEPRAGNVSWTGKVKLTTDYRIAIDCTGSRGSLTIEIEGRFRGGHACFGRYNVTKLDAYPEGPLRVSKVLIRAPADAAWSVLIARV